MALSLCVFTEMPIQEKTSMSLKEYRRKRQFHRTPEPDSSEKIKPGKGQLSFVVQKHDASRTHYDFRLEIGGALVSWAVPKGPTLTSQNPRLAVKVEDHPLKYGKFEGVIPPGNYGAGTVMIWDSGHYIERSSKGRKDSEKALKEGLEKGHITFILFGEKLKGEFALVKIKKKGAPDNGWLLLKKHDAEASRIDILEEDHSVASGRSMEEITSEAVAKGQVWIPKRKTTQPKAIVPSSRAARDVLPRKIKVMQPVTSAKIPSGGDYFFEAVEKGLRAIAEIDSTNIRLYSRMFLPFEKKYGPIVQALRSLETTAVFDGEIVKKGKTDVYLISDLLYYKGQDLRNVSLKTRSKQLESISFQKPLVVSELSTDPAKIASPDIIAKAQNSTYVSGLSKEWLRLKNAVSQSGETSVLKKELPALTHPSKIFWPKEGYTKGDLARYYESIADFLIPHLKDRPQSLHRQPNGLKDEGFFHKDMTGYLPKRIRTVKVFSESAKKTVNYLLCQDVWTLLYLVNLGCIELNPWLSREKTLENPDYVVIDLDPDGNDFKDVVKVALEVHRMLDKIGAKNYCKTSGASGLHLCIPTQGKYDFETGRLFAEELCRQVHAKFPELTSVERNPAKRKGKIYLDFLQNRRGQTLAAPYCVRPKPKATVSTPLKWSEVKPGLSPLQFTIENTEKRLKRVGDLWAPLLSETVNLEKCMKQLLKLRHS